MNEDQRAVAGEIAGGPRGGVRGPFIPLLHNPRLAKRVHRLGETLRFESTLPDPIVELVVLVTARRWTCQYEWVAHERLARKAGLAPAIIEAIAEGRRPDSMSAEESTAYRLAIEAFAAGSPDEATFAEGQGIFGLDGTLDLLALCGYYTLLAFILNTAQLPLPEGAAPPLRSRD